MFVDFYGHAWFHALFCLAKIVCRNVVPNFLAPWNVGKIWLNLARHYLVSHVDSKSITILTHLAKIWHRIGSKPTFIPKHGNFWHCWNVGLSTWGIKPDRPYGPTRLYAVFVLPMYPFSWPPTSHKTISNFKFLSIVSLKMCRSYFEHESFSRKNYEKLRIQKH